MNKLEEQWAARGNIEAMSKTLEAKGIDPKRPALEDLSSLDQLHAGQIAGTRRFAEWVGLTKGTRILDLGSGLGGAARLLARDFDCHVTALDPVQSLHAAGMELTSRTCLDSKVSHFCGTIFDLGDSCLFDLVWIQHVDVHLEDKERVYAAAASHLAEGGRVVWHDWLRQEGFVVSYPVPWSRDGTVSHPATREQFADAIEADNLCLKRFESVENITRGWFEKGKADLNRLLKKDQVLGREHLEAILQEVESVLANMERGALLPFFAEAVKKHVKG